MLCNGRERRDRERRSDERHSIMQPRVVACLLFVCSQVAAYVPVGALPNSRQQCARTTGGPVMVMHRRQAMQGLFLTAAAIVSPSAAVAADGKANVWISGKSDPIRKTSKDKPDGTKKDNKYLGCLNDCVPRKQGPPGPSQLERADCLDACQQECCSTYEQCTYTIRKF